MELELTWPIVGYEQKCQKCGQWWWAEFSYVDTQGKTRQVAAAPCDHATRPEDDGDEGYQDA